MLFLLNLKDKINFTKKIKFRVIVLSKSGGLDDIIESQKKYNKNILYLNCSRAFIITIFNTIFGNQASNNIKFFSNQLKKQREEYENFFSRIFKSIKKNIK